MEEWCGTCDVVNSREWNWWSWSDFAEVVTRNRNRWYKEKGMWFAYTRHMRSVEWTKRERSVKYVDSWQHQLRYTGARIGFWYHSRYLMYGRIGCTESEMMEAADSFIRSFPEGLRHVWWRAWSIPFGWTEATHCDCPSAPASSACPGSWRGYEYLGVWEILDGVEGVERESSVNDGISFEQDCGYHLRGSRWCDSGSGKTWGVVEELRLLREPDSWMDWVW